MPRLPRWSLDEIAFILNYTDFCLIRGINYRQTAAEELQRITTREISFRKVSDALSTFLKKCKVEIHFNKLIDEGTRTIDDMKLSSDLEQTMERQRAEWGIGTLAQRETYIPQPLDINSEVCLSLAFVYIPLTYKQFSRANPGTSGFNPGSRQATRAPEMSTDQHSGQLKAIVAIKKRGRPPKCGSHPRPRPLADDDSREHGNDCLEERNPGGMKTKIDRRKQQKLYSSNTLQSPTISPLTPPCTSNHNQIVTRNQADPDSDFANINFVDQATITPIYDMLGWLVREKLDARQDIPDDIYTTMRTVCRTIGHEPGSTFQRILQDICQVNKSRESYEKILRDLIGQRNFGITSTFPPQPAVNNIKTTWYSVRDTIKDAMQFRNTHVTERMIVVSAAFLSTQLDVLVGGTSIWPRDFFGWIKQVDKPLGDPVTAQAIMGIVLCCLLFYGPEPMCPEVRWSIATKIYEMRSVLGISFTLKHPMIFWLTSLVGEIEEVRQLDRIATQCWFKDPHFQDVVLPERTSTILKCIRACWDAISSQVKPTRSDAEVVSILEEAIQPILELKQALMVSSYEYRIRFIPPESLFDSTWMEAEDKDGQHIEPAHCFGKKILVCVFPALVQYQTRKLPSDAGVSAALAQNKRFFPTREEVAAFGAEDIIAKAFVVL
jgi:hypothetical protein